MTLRIQSSLSTTGEERTASVRRRNRRRGLVVLPALLTALFSLPAPVARADFWDDLVDFIVPDDVFDIALFIANPIDYLVGLSAAERGAIEALTPGGSPLPAQTKQTLLDLTRGTAFQLTRTDVDLARIEPGDSTLGATWLPSSRRGITLDDVIVLRRSVFDIVMAGNKTAQKLLENPGTDETRAFDLLVPEMVHVRQYQEVGFNGFLVTYAAQIAAEGYDGADYEDEAYQLASRVARQRGGEYCSDLINYYVGKEEERNLTLRVDPCKPKPSLIWLLSGA